MTKRRSDAATSGKKLGGLLRATEESVPDRRSATEAAPLSMFRGTSVAVRQTRVEYSRVVQLSDGDDTTLIVRGSLHGVNPCVRGQMKPLRRTETARRRVRQRCTR